MRRWLPLTKRRGRGWSGVSDEKLPAPLLFREVESSIGERSERQVRCSRPTIPHHHNSVRTKLTV